MAGMGGGFVMIPLLRQFVPHVVSSQHAAHGTSLCAVVATGFAGAITYGDHIHAPAAAAVTATAMVTAIGGAWATRFVSGPTLQRALAIWLLVLAPVVPAKAYVMERYKQQQLPAGGVTADAQETNKQGAATEDETNTAVPLFQSAEQPWTSLYVPAAIGIVSGFLAGLFGVGGGTVVVPALVLGMGNDTDKNNKFTYHQALATSLAAMVLPAAVGTWTHAQVGNVAWRVAPPLALGALVGAYLGGKVALQTKEVYLQWGFSALLTVLGIRTLWKA
jgi:uncharacterized protein